jgi:hypothetical protein
VKRVLTDVDADDGDSGTEMRHGVLLVFGAPSQLPSLAVLEHGRTIPILGDIAPLPAMSIFGLCRKILVFPKLPQAPG